MLASAPTDDVVAGSRRSGWRCFLAVAQGLPVEPLLDASLIAPCLPQGHGPELRSAGEFLIVACIISRKNARSCRLIVVRRQQPSLESDPFPPVCCRSPLGQRKGCSSFIGVPLCRPVADTGQPGVSSLADKQTFASRARLTHGAALSKMAA